MPACVGCGYCCKQAPCVLAMIKFDLDVCRPDGTVVCPALKSHDNRYWCDFAEEHREGLAIGAGCGSSLNSDRRNMIISMKGATS